MLEAIHYLRKAIIEKLTGEVVLNSQTLQVYNRVPSNAVAPFIIVYSVSSDEVDQNQTSFTMKLLTRIEVVTRFNGDNGGELDCNLAISKILSLLRTRSANYLDLTQYGFKVYTSVNEGVTYLTNDLKDHTYFRAVLELSNRVEPI
tara:strand:+ start:3047 stop:3484 length:438 start_codon:yes stop_codon:yes gene_type:complete